MRNLVKTVAQALLWPFRRFFDPRFVGLHEAVTQARHAADNQHREAMIALQHAQGDVTELHWLIRADMDATNEAVTLIGRSLRDIETMVEEARRGSLSAVEELAEGSIDQLDGGVTQLLNYADSHEGFAAQRGLWFNPPVLIRFAPGDAYIGHVNERIAEVPFVFRALARVPQGAQILDVGASESTVCLSLATCGYRVTAIDPRPNRLSHPNLRVVVGRIEDFDEPRKFQATVCLSTIEHIGVGAYGQEGAERADLAAMRRLHELTEAGGLLILTTSYGPSGVDEFSRTYDRDDLDELLRGWSVDEFSLLARQDETTWVPLDPAAEPSRGEEAELVAMIAATRLD
jgi:methyltransferase family protein